MALTRNREYDYLFKVVIIGTSGVGKSSVLLRFSDDQFNETYLTTIGVDFRFKTLTQSGKRVKLQIWDTAGQERFRTITNAYYKGADAIIVVYDVTQAKTFADIDEYWLKEVERNADKGVEITLIGNKCDANDEERQVDTATGEEFARARQMQFFETSAKINEGVADAFSSVAGALIAKKDAQMKQKRRAKRETAKKAKGQPSPPVIAAGAASSGDATDTGGNSENDDNASSGEEECATGESAGAREESANSVQLKNGKSGKSDVETFKQNCMALCSTR